MGRGDSLGRSHRVDGRARGVFHAGEISESLERLKRTRRPPKRTPWSPPLAPSPGGKPRCIRRAVPPPGRSRKARHVQANNAGTFAAQFRHSRDSALHTHVQVRPLDLRRAGPLPLLARLGGRQRYTGGPSRRRPVPHSYPWVSVSKSRSRLAPWPLSGAPSTTFPGSGRLMGGPPRSVSPVSPSCEKTH